jgi:hypothetical protein
MASVIRGLKSTATIIQTLRDGQTLRCAAGPLARRPAGLLACWLATLTLLLAPPAMHAADSPAALEYKIKAGYLYNFAKYIEWPAKTLPATNSPIVIGVLDGAGALPVVQSIFQNKSVAGRPLQVKAVFPTTLDASCHILFLTRAAGPSPLEVRQTLGSAATLLVGEDDQFAERGGMIGFVREEDSFRVHLNLEAATQAGLKVSAKLSSVAKVVKSKAGP